MINFSKAAISNTISSVKTQVQHQQAQTSNAQAAVVNFSQFAQTSFSDTAAMKSKIAASDINFNKNFYNNIQYLNAQASMGIFKQVDGKIFVSTDVFSMKEQRPAVSQLQGLLNNMDNLAKDKNSSQSLLYTRTDSNKKHTQENTAVFFQSSRLQNVYA